MIYIEIKKRRMNIVASSRDAQPNIARDFNYVLPSSLCKHALMLIIKSMKSYKATNLEELGAGIIFLCKFKDSSEFFLLDLRSPPLRVSVGGIFKSGGVDTDSSMFQLAKGNSLQLVLYYSYFAS